MINEEMQYKGKQILHYLIFCRIYFLHRILFKCNIKTNDVFY